MTAAAVSHESAPAPARRPDSVIELDHVSRWYGDVVAVSDISCAIGPGITGVLGPNGAGKSTLLHMIAGLLRPSSGAVHVSGDGAWGTPALYRRLGFLPEQEASYPFLTGAEFVRLSARLYEVPDAARATAAAIELVQLTDVRDRRLETYSKGMRQRIRLAATLVHDPTIVVLDEPFNGMDPRQRLLMMSVLEQQAALGRVILISSHILEEVDRIASNVLVIVAGKLAASGNAREIRRLMTDRPHTFTIRSSDDRRLAACLIAEPSVRSVALADDVLTVHTMALEAFCRALPRAAREHGITILESIPADESLDSVFSYLQER